MSNIENNNVELNTNEVAEAAPVAAKPKKKASPFKKVAQFVTPDGVVHETQKAASEHMRKHLKIEAVKALAETFDAAQESLGDFLMRVEVELKDAYDAAKIDRPAPSAETLEKMRQAREKQLADLRAFKEHQAKLAAEAAGQAAE